MTIRLDCPLAANLLMHHYCICEPFPNNTAPAVVEERNRLVLAGVLVAADNGSGWATTPRGDAWVRDLLARPAPTQAWINKDGEVVT